MVRKLTLFVIHVVAFVAALHGAAAVLDVELFASPTSASSIVLYVLVAGAVEHLLGLLGFTADRHDYHGPHPS